MHQSVAMPATPFSAVSTASAVLALSKTAWKLGSALSKLDQDNKVVDTTVKILAGEVKSFSNECDLVYAELEEVISKSETGSPPPHNFDGRIWDCLTAEVEETSQTIEELELYVKGVRGEVSSFIGQAQRQRKLDQSKNQIANIRTKVFRHTENLRNTLLLINTVLAYIAPGRADRKLARELDKLQDMVEKLQRLSEAGPQSQLSHTEITLMQCACEVILKGTTMYEASVARESVSGDQRVTNNNIRVAEWLSTLESLRRDQRRSDPSETATNGPFVFSGDEAHTVMASVTCKQFDLQECKDVDDAGDESEDDLETDLAKAALETGTKSFEAQEWEEADSLLQETLRVLQNLSKKQRAFCDIFFLHYKLAICAYHTREPAEAEEALMSLVQQSASSDEQRGYVYDAAHLLSLLYIRMGQLDCAKSECEKSLQARRRLLGKQSKASLESTALMAQICFLLNNRARAKSYLAMIPEECRDTILKTVQESLGTKVEHLDSPALPNRKMSSGSDIAGEHIQSRLSATSFMPSMETRSSGPVPTEIPQSPAASLRQSHIHNPSNKPILPALNSVTVRSLSSTEEKGQLRAREKVKSNDDYPSSPKALNAATPSSNEPPEANETFESKTLSRKEILDKIGCQPKDRIEEAVCEGDHSTFTSLLNKKKDFWQSKLRKRVRPERVTALHFAALFGEIDMARRLLASSFNINEVPYGYSTSITPLKFAIGARQVDMVDFLIANGAKPSEPDSWSTLAGQLMNRSWLMKTMSEAEKEVVPSRIIAILGILLKHGWNVDMPFEASGKTVLHQAVTFWTGSYLWDLNLRAVVTSFLCEQGASPFQVNKEGMSPYDIASTSGHEDLLLVLNRGTKKNEPAEPVELPT